MIDKPFFSPSRRSVLALLLGVSSISAEESPIQPKPGSLKLEDLEGSDKFSDSAKKIITSVLSLSGRGLGYKMGSADPAAGGMDCSGTVYRALIEAGFTDVPRSSDAQYRWTWEKGAFRAVNGRTRKSFEFSKLQPGCLLFWTGTYATVDRDPPISHVMIYLGKEKKDGREVMAGASDGRPYRGQGCYGVGVFDFVLPKPESTSRFVGYAQV